MRAIWLLTTNACTGRPARTLLLACAVACSTALVVAVACAMASLTAGLESRLAARLGSAHVVIRHASGDRFDRSLIDQLRNSEGVDQAWARMRGAVSIRADVDLPPNSPIKSGFLAFNTVDLAATQSGVGTLIEEGRNIRAKGEITLNTKSAQALGVTVGDHVTALPTRQAVQANTQASPVDLEVVGLFPTLPFEAISSATGSISLHTFDDLTGLSAQTTEVLVTLNDASAADQWAREIGPTLPTGLIAETSARVSTGLEAMASANSAAFVVSTAMASLSSAFIVLTGLGALSSGRQRELATLRCIGATRTTLAKAQLMTGLAIGLIGAIIGTPLGMGLAWLLAVLVPERMPAGVTLWPSGMAIALLGALAAGLLGAAWPAWQASRQPPAAALRPEKSAVSKRALLSITVVGLALIAFQQATIALSNTADQLLLFHTFLGLPALFIGTFLLGIPITWLVGCALAPLLAKLLRIPKGLVTRSTAASPVRTGMTAGALMVGLAMMIAVWTNGSALLRDWIGSIKFPDAFVNASLAGGIDDNMRQRIEQLDFIENTSAITLFKTGGGAFGLNLFGNKPQTTFIAFEVEPFFEMTELMWAAGDPEYAVQRLTEGGAILVAKEFLIEREGFHIGSPYTIEHAGKEHTFEIVGAVSSPGLDIVSKYFDLGEEYSNYAIHAIFGSRADLIEYFGRNDIDLLQLKMNQSVNELSDADAIARVREAVDAPGAIVGSGREIKEGITKIGTGSMQLATIVAMGAMFAGALGAGNILIASIDARRRELGVLRAVGATPSVLARTLIAETLVVSTSACALGLYMGIASAWAGTRMYALAAGLELSNTPPAEAVLIGFVILTAITLLVTAPIIIRVAREKPRALLGAAEG